MGVPGFLLMGLLVLFHVQNGTPKIVSTNPDDIKIYLYNYKGNTNLRDQFTFTSLIKQTPLLFNPFLPTVIYTHGYWNPDLVIRQNPVIAAYNRFAVPVNVILVDWQLLSNPIGIPLAGYFMYYPFVVKQNVATTGRRVGELVTWLVENNLAQLDRIHLIGESLGGHVMGIAGSCVEQKLTRKVGRITGLDPAWPLYQVNPAHLTQNDAQFVDVVHTNAGLIGTPLAVGHVDIWVNGGKKQFPICLLSNPEPEPWCSHDYSATVFAYSVNRPLTACRSTPGFLGLSHPNNTNIIVPPSIGPTLPGGCRDPIVLGPFTNWGARGNFDVSARVVVTPLLTAAIP